MSARHALAAAAVLAAAAATVYAAPALTAAEQLQFADGIYTRGLHESAVGEYLALLRDFPDAPEAAAALFRTGECYRQLGNAQGAERFYRRVAAEHPGTPLADRAELRRAELEIDAGKPADAADRLRALRTRDRSADLSPALEPDTAAAAAYELGRALRDAGDADAAQAAWEELLATGADSAYLGFAALDLAALRADSAPHADRIPGWYATAAEKAATPGAKAEALYRWGEWSFKRGDHAAAADTLRALRTEAPSSRRARESALLLGWSLYYLDRAPEALDLADEAESAAPSAPAAASAAYLRAAALRRMNRDGEALLGFSSVLRDYPGTPFAGRAAYEVMATHFKRGDHAQVLAAAPARPEPAQEADVLWMRAESERALSRPADARTHYAALAENHPRSPHAPDALRRLGDLERDAGRDAEAAAWYLRAADAHPDPAQSTSALEAAALCLQRAGDAEGALAAWDRLADPAAGAPDLAAVRLHRALALLELGRDDDARAAFDALLADAPHGPAAAQALYWRGTFLARDAAWPDAETAFRAVLAEPADPATASRARAGLVQSLQRQDRMDEAADQTEPLLADPVFIAENPALVEWLLKLRTDQGQTTRALRAARELAENAPTDAWRQIAWYWTGVCRDRTGDSAAAAEAYERAVALPATTRQGTEALLALADADRDAGRYDLALSRYTAAAEQARDDDALDLRTRAYFGLGETEEAAGRPSEAARRYRIVSVLFDDPELSPRALFRAGLLYRQAARPDEAAQAFSELTSRYPESPYALQAAEIDTPASASSSEQAPAEDPAP